MTLVFATQGGARVLSLKRARTPAHPWTAPSRTCHPAHYSNRRIGRSFVVSELKKNRITVAAPLHALLPLQPPAAGLSEPSVSVRDKEGVPGSNPVSAWLRKVRQFILYPWSPWQQAWTGLATLAAAFSAFLIPWEVAFQPADQIYDLNNPLTVVDAVLSAVFTLDMLLSFRTAYYEGEAVVEDRGEISRQYLQGNFFLDLMSMLPLDLLALAACVALGLFQLGEIPAWVPTLKLLNMARLYRVRSLFEFLEYNLSFSLLTTTILRNLVIVLYICHFVACAFFWEGLQSGFNPDILLGADVPFFTSLPPTDQYIYSLYWAVTSLATVDFGDHIPSSMPQTISAAARAALFMAFNITLGSYILGTITLLVVKKDERTGQFRDRSASLRQYTAANNIPHELKESMQGHLRLAFETGEASDEQVLSIFPTPIRRRIMRYLYIDLLRSSYLLKACPSKFLDALLASARIEVFMPGVDILSSGDQVNELLLLLSGSVEMLVPDSATVASAHGGSSSGGVNSGQQQAPGAKPHGSGGSSSSSSFEGDWREVAAAWEAAREGARGSIPATHPFRASREGLISRLEIGEGSMLGEVAFFTEVPQLESLRSVTVCRVMLVNRAAYASLERSFPAASRQVLQNLMEAADQAVSAEFQGNLAPERLQALCNNFEELQVSWGAAELVDTLASAALSLPMLTGDKVPDISGWSPEQQQAVANLLRIRSLVREYISRQDMEATSEFLYAAAQGNVSRVRQMIQQGCPPDIINFDGRTALELASMKGHGEVAVLLLSSGANPNLRDYLESSALFEACRHGHDDIIALLKQHGARLGNGGGVDGAVELCKCVVEGNLPLLRRLLEAGIPVDSRDYDKRTALHIGAAEGNLQAVKLLVQEGRADAFIQDRWGHTPIDEAQKVGAAPVVEFLADHITKCRRSSLAGLDGGGI